MNWRIDYTNEPWLKKRRRKELETEVAKSIHRIKELLQDQSEDGFRLGDSGFSVEAVWVDRVQRHLVAVLDRNVRWVAYLILDRYPCLGVEKVKDLLRKLGLSETNIYGIPNLTTTNEETVGRFLAELEADLRQETDERVRRIRLINKAFLEGFLEKGVIKVSDGLLDAHRKIQKYTTATEKHASARRS